MDIRDRRGLRAEAHRVLQEAPSDPKKLILIHAGITAGVLLTATVLNILLGLWIDASVGLGGIGRRTVLATIQTMIQVCCNVALPFWEFGYFFAALRFAREQKADTNTLLSGFRHFGPVLRLSLLKALLFAGTGMASVYAGTMLYMMMPWGSSLMAAMEPVMQEAMRTGATEALSDQVTALIMAEAMPELLLVAGAIFLAIAAPIFYRLRFSVDYNAGNAQNSELEGFIIEGIGKGEVVSPQEPAAQELFAAETSDEFSIPEDCRAEIAIGLL